MSLASLFFRTAILLAIAGIMLGIFMGVNQDFRLAHMHAHLNLLGWVSFSSFSLSVLRRPRRAGRPHLPRSPAARSPASTSSRTGS